MPKAKLRKIKMIARYSNTHKYYIRKKSIERTNSGVVARSMEINGRVETKKKELLREGNERAEIIC
jgi:hypothetical protein